MIDLKPTPVFDTYWRFAAERQRIYLRRLEGESGPWTNDPILARYRFTNSYRASDRVSQYLIREVQYRPDRSHDPVEVVFRTLLFKIFNKIETWELLENQTGPLSWQSFDLPYITEVLDRARSRGTRIYSAAYIMPSPAMGQPSKHANHLHLLEQQFRGGLPARLLAADSLKTLYDVLVAIPSFGPFLAFQYAIDLNYSHAFAHDEAEFVVPGPGALDGISKCFEASGIISPDDIIMEVTRRQEAEFERLDIDFPGLFGRRLQPIDCQNLFCEISKYARVAHPEYTGSAGRTKIKQSYQPLPQALAQPFFPPRWGLHVPTFVPAPIATAQHSLF